MAWTAPKTWAVNEVVTAANMNTHVRDNENWLGNDFPRCKANRTGTQSIPDSTATAVQLDDTDTFDVGAMHSPVTNNTRLTVPSGGGGAYFFTGEAHFAANGTGHREAAIRINGTTIIARVRELGTSSTIAAVLNVSGAHQLVATDYLELVVTQASGGAL